ncbi:transcriptional regulator [Qipengyuania sp. SS22]|uniref:anti-sigma factor family protein n=1 Tax=Qipengyuania sp. SS22 TaxID=2979461 RepID=UPI0021E62795|nr:transcriptional regulator [Qipengyuania sp. SS22]UYH55466.1 transcriptional regulator [Qipengyuania sp. SS22]
MTITREELAAFADGELPPKRASEVAAAVEGDPELAHQLATHQALKSRLAGHFAPLAEEPVPERLSDMLAQKTAPVADMGAARERRQARRTLPRWSWVVGPALAASLALAVFLPRGEAPDGYAGAQLAGVLDTRLVAEQGADEDTRILLSFRDADGEFCRAFTAEAGSGIACRDARGWKLEALGEGATGAQTEYRTAGGGTTEILVQAQQMADGAALDAEAEAAARAAGWQ